VEKKKGKKAFDRTGGRNSKRVHYLKNAGAPSRQERRGCEKKPSCGSDQRDQGCKRLTTFPWKGGDKGGKKGSGPTAAEEGRGDTLSPKKRDHYAVVEKKRECGGPGELRIEETISIFDLHKGRTARVVREKKMIKRKGALDEARQSNSKGRDRFSQLHLPFGGVREFSRREKESSPDLMGMRTRNGGAAASPLYAGEKRRMAARGEEEGWKETRSRDPDKVEEGGR